MPMKISSSLISTLLTLSLALTGFADANSELFTAARNGDLPQVKSLIAAGADVNAKHRYGFTPLINAVRSSDYRRAETVKVLLAAGADVNAISMYDNNGWTALFYAISFNHSDAVKLLLDAGVDMNARNNEGQTALMMADERRRIEEANGRAEDIKKRREIASLLRSATLDKSKNPIIGKPSMEIDDVNRAEINDKLLSAIRNADIQQVRRLIITGADVNVRSSRNGSGSNTTSRDGKGIPLIKWAAGKHVPSEITKLLINAGADVNATDDGSTALISAATHGKSETVKLLIAAGADVNAFEGGNSFALQGAAMQGEPESVKLLLAAGANVNARDYRGVPALRPAVVNARTEVVQMLLNAGADVNIVDPDGYYVLMLAAEDKRRTEILRLLLKAGANVNPQGSRGDTALMCAASSGYVEHVRMLLVANADPTIKNNEGKTALMMAEEMEYKNVVRLLRNAKTPVVKPTITQKTTNRPPTLPTKSPTLDSSDLIEEEENIEVIKDRLTTALNLPEIIKVVDIFLKEIKNKSSIQIYRNQQLQASYQKKLTELRTQYQQRGELKGLVAVENEMNRFKEVLTNGGDEFDEVPEMPQAVLVTEPDSLRTAQDNFLRFHRELVATRKDDIKKLTEQFTGRLIEIQREFVKTGATKNALSIHTLINRFKDANTLEIFAFAQTPKAKRLFDKMCFNYSRRVLDNPRQCNKLFARHFHQYHPRHPDQLLFRKMRHGNNGNLLIIFLMHFRWTADYIPPSLNSWARQGYPMT